MKKSNLELLYQILFYNLIGMLMIVFLYIFTGIEGSFIFGFFYFIFFVINIFFQSIFSIVISKITDEYNYLGYYKQKYKFYKFGVRIFIFIGLFMFIFMFLSSDILSKLLFKNIVDIKLIYNISSIIKIFSISMLIIPILNFYRGYISGNKLNNSVFISRLLESLSIFIFMLFGCLIGINFFHFSSIQCIQIFAFSYCIGVLISFLYLIFIYHRHNKIINKETMKVTNVVVTDKAIFNKIYSDIHLYLNIWLFHLIVYFVDIVMIIRITANKSYYSIVDLKTMVSFFSVLGFQLFIFFMLIIIIYIFRKIKSINIEKLVTIFPNLLTKILYIVLPYTFIISILGNSIWKIFYSVNDFASRIFKYYILILPIFIIFVLIILVLKHLKEEKRLIKFIYIGLVTKILLNLPLIYAFDKMKFPMCYGSITSTIIGYFVIVCLSLNYISKNHKIAYEECISSILNIFISSIVMAIVLLIISYLFPCTSRNVFINLLYSMFVFGIGIIIYNGICLKMGLINNKLLSKKVK